MSTLNPDESAKVPAGSDQRELDDALGNVDPLLMASLRDDEKKRLGRRRWVLAVAIGVVVMAASAVLFSLFMQKSPQSKATNLASEGWRLWQEREFAEAESKFAEAVTLDANLENAWNGLGWARLNQAKAAEAIVAFQRCVELADAHPAANNGLGQSYFFQRKFDEAEKYLLKAAPQASAAWYGLCKLYLLQGKFEEARKWGEKIAGQNPNDPSIARLLAAAKAGKLDDDLRSMIEPPEISSGSGAAQRGWQLFNRGSMMAAKAEFEKSLASDPDNASALNGLAFCLLNVGQVAEAKLHFEKMLAKTPNSAGLLNGLARCLKAEGKVDEAIATWEKLEKLVPTVSAATVGLAVTHYERGEYQKAIVYLERLVESDPDNEHYQDRLEAARTALQDN